MIKIGIVPKYNNENNRYIFSTRLIDIMILHSICPILLLDKNQFSECDGFILGGGKDINPTYYHQNKHKTTQCENNKIETLEFEVVDYCFHNQKQLLGICRGMQIIHVYFHGELNQYIENHQSCWHKINSKIEYFPQKAYSDHHQSIKEILPFFEVLAYSEDHIIEAFSYACIMGVQWHPEFDENELILPHFFERILTNKINQK